MAPQDIRARWQALADRVWAAAALGALVELGVAERLSEPAGTEELAAGAGVPAPLVEALLDVVAAVGLVERRADGGYHGAELASAAADRAFAADVRSSLLQSAELAHRTVAGDRDLVGWRYTDPVVLQAQGASSAGAVAMLERVVFPAFDGLEERLRDGDGRFLDVGAGVAAVTVEMCRRYPALRAVAIEPQEAPLALARRNVEAAGLTDRIELRRATTLVACAATSAPFTTSSRPRPTRRSAPPPSSTSARSAGPIGRRAPTRRPSTTPWTPSPRRRVGCSRSS